MEKDTFSFKQEQEIPAENRREKNQAVGAGALSTVKPPEKIIETFEDAKKNDAIPEGVRDEQDYREYLAEQEAKNKEFEKFDNKIFENIMSIENPDDRDLATAILPYYYNDELDDEGARGRKDIAKREGMKAVVDYMNGDKKKPLEDALVDVGQKFFNDPEHDRWENARVSRAVFGRLDDDLDDLIEGQRLGQLDVSEAESNEYTYKFVFSPDKDRLGYGSCRFERNIFFETEEEKDCAKVALNLANDLAKRINESDNYDDILKDQANLITLSNVYGSRIEESLEEEEQHRLSETLSSARKIMDSEDFNVSESSLPFSHTGLLGLMNIRELENDFKDYLRKNARYKKAVKVGRAILNGEKDWHEVDVVHDIIRGNR